MVHFDVQTTRHKAVRSDDVLPFLLAPRRQYVFRRWLYFEVFRFVPNNIGPFSNMTLQYLPSPSSPVKPYVAAMTKATDRTNSVATTRDSKV